MAFDGITVAALACELNTVLKDGRIAKIIQPEADELILTIKTFSGQYRLLLSADASLPIAYLTSQNKQAPMTAPGFCMLLRKHLQSGRITAITQPGLERILRFDIEHLNEMGDLCSKSLIIELMGRHSNIIFCAKDADGKMIILDSIKHISSVVSSVRQVLPGKEYFIPNTMEKSDPLLRELSFDEFSEEILSKPVSAAKALYTSLTGFSPLMAQELCYRSGIDGEMSTASLAELTKDALYNQYLYLVRDLKNRNFSPQIVYDLPADFSLPLPYNAQVREFSAFKLSMFEDRYLASYDSISALLEAFYAKKNLVTRIRQRSADLRHICQTALERNIKKLDLQSKQLKDTEKMDKYRVYGELINAYGYSLPVGSKELIAENYYDNNNSIKIPLDPMFTPQENSKRYFDKYQKLKRTRDAVSELINTTQAEIEHLQSVLMSLDIALSEDDLSQIRQELSETGYIKKTVSGKNNKGKTKTAKGEPLHYISSDGYDIYVGKNNLQNDQLTFKFANGGDWWFHAKKIAGSHVIVKNPGNDEMPDRVYEEAAALAAYYSQGKEQSLVEVDYLQRKNVKKPNGAKPGFVVYYTNYSLSIKPDISMLKQL